MSILQNITATAIGEWEAFGAQVIDLSAREAVCYVCNATCPAYWGIPVYEGYVLPNDWLGEWGGVDACVACWQQQQALTTPMLAQTFRSLVARAGRQR